MDFYCKRCEKTYKTEKGFANHKCYRYCKHCFGKWKTDKGYEKHVCRSSPEYARTENEKRMAIEENRVRLEKRLEELSSRAQSLGLFKYRVGDAVFGSYYVVTKPTHEYNGYGRLVRKRYEERRSYLVRKFAISKIWPSVNAYESALDALESDIEARKPLSGTYFSEGWNEGIPEKNVFSDEAEAAKASSEMQRSYQEYLELCSRCR